MQLLIAVSVVIQLYCAYRSLAAGKSIFWTIFILAVPLVGWLSYLACEALDQAALSSAIAHATDDAFSGADSSVDLAKLRDEVALSDTIFNRQNLAEGLLRRREFKPAIAEYEKCLSLGSGNDPKLLLELSLARFLDGQFAAARESLEKLSGSKPEYEPPRRDLLLARTLEQLGDLDGALRKYDALAGWPGEEVACRRALLLKKMGKGDEAARSFAEILARAKRASDAEKREQRRWIELAQKNAA